MFDISPDPEQLTALIGKSLYSVWAQLRAMIEKHYDMERLWDKGGKAWTYECKYRRGGKTLCALYAGKNRMGFMIIFGKAERLIFERNRESFSAEAQHVYDKAQTYHDGKWMMFEPSDTSLFDDFLKLLQIKRKPNRFCGNER